MDRLVVETDAGRLVAKPSTVSNRPGIWISLDDDDFVLVDCTGTIITTHVWDRDCDNDSIVEQELKHCDCCHEKEES